jgi:hypothetical protein
MRLRAEENLLSILEFEGIGELALPPGTSEEPDALFIRKDISELLEYQREAKREVEKRLNCKD